MSMTCRVTRMDVLRGLQFRTIQPVVRTWPSVVASTSLRCHSRSSVLIGGHMYRLCMLVALASIAACGGDSSSSPSSPSTVASGVSVTVTSPVRMGQTTQATGSATLSSGQAQPVTTGWLSDATAVATVSDAGLVTGVANGRATIYVVSGGRQGQQVIRVVPDYQGQWNGGLRITSCTETGFFAEFDFCEDFAVGDTSGYTLAVSQSGEQISATPSYGAAVFSLASAPIRDDGSSAFSSTFSVTDSGVTLTLEANWVINSLRVGELSGTVSEVWRLPNVNGEGRLVQSIFQTTRSRTSALSSGGDSVKARAMRRLAGQDR